MCMPRVSSGTQSDSLKMLLTVSVRRPHSEEESLLEIVQGSVFLYSRWINNDTFFTSTLDDHLAIDHASNSAITQSRQSKYGQFNKQLEDQSHRPSSFPTTV